MVVGFPLNMNNNTRMDIDPGSVVTREIKYPSFGKCFEIELDQFGEPVQYVHFYLKEPAYVYVSTKGHFHNSDSYAKVDVKLKQCLFIDLTYEVIKQNANSQCKRYTEETYDVCCERAAESHLVGVYNCTAPFINSPNNVSVCTDKSKTSKVSNSKGIIEVYIESTLFRLRKL
jgi:hypothetical protein